MLAGCRSLDNAGAPSLFPSKGRLHKRSKERTPGGLKPTRWSEALVWESGSDHRVGHSVFKSSLRKGNCADAWIGFCLFVLAYHSPQVTFICLGPSIISVFLFYFMYRGVWAACVSMQCISAQELLVQWGLFKPHVLGHRHSSYPHF